MNVSRFAGKALSGALKNNADDVAGDLLSKTLKDIVKDKAIDTTKKGFGKELFDAYKTTVFNSPAKEAQQLVDAFPKLFRGDYGAVGKDLIEDMSGKGGAVLSMYANHPGFNMSKTPRTLGVSRNSLDNFFKATPDNGFMANATGELIGSPRTSEIYNGAIIPEDALEFARNTVLDKATANNSINSLKNYGGADDFTQDLLESIFSGTNSVNEIKMPIGRKDITSSLDNITKKFDRLQDDVVVTLRNGETISVPANSLLGGFDGLGKTAPLSIDALKANPREAIYNKLSNDYGKEQAAKIMADYGGDITKSKSNSFLGNLLSGRDVQDPLVMYHGVGESKLDEILKLAEETGSDYAIPNPSLQVIDPNKTAGTSYGDIILLGNKDIPKNISQYTGLPEIGGKYNLYSRDVYSPRKPNIEYKGETPYISGTRTVATPENISKYMNKQGTKAVESNWATPGSMAATQAKRFKSPLEAIKDADKIQPQDVLKEAFAEWDTKVDDSAQTILDKYIKEKDPGEINRFSYTDYITTELQDAMAGKAGWDDPYGINTTDFGKNIVKDLKNTAANLPTAYFEAKPNRAVKLSEFGGVVLPEGYNNQRILDAMKKSGIEVQGFYDPNNYEESLGSTLRNLIKGKDRLDTKYMLGLSGLLGLGGLGTTSGKKDNKKS